VSVHSASLSPPSYDRHGDSANGRKLANLHLPPCPIGVTRHRSGPAKYLRLARVFITFVLIQLEISKLLINRRKNCSKKP